MISAETKCKIICTYLKLIINHASIFIFRILIISIINFTSFTRLIIFGKNVLQDGRFSTKESSMTMTYALLLP